MASPPKIRSGGGGWKNDLNSQFLVGEFEDLVEMALESY
jgi:hypothetical protein